MSEGSPFFFFADLHLVYQFHHTLISFILNTTLRMHDLLCLISNLVHFCRRIFNFNFLSLSEFYYTHLYRYILHKNIYLFVLCMYQGLVYILVYASHMCLVPRRPESCLSFHRAWMVFFNRWVLVNKLQPSTNLSSPLNYWVISHTPCFYFYKIAWCQQLINNYDYMLSLQKVCLVNIFIKQFTVIYIWFIFFKTPVEI